MIKSIILLPFLLLGCGKKLNYQADFDIKAHKSMNIEKKDRFYIKSGDNNKSTENVVKSFKEYYTSIGQPLSNNAGQADVILTINSTELNTKSLNITDSVKESAKNILHGNKPVKIEDKKKYLLVKATFEKVIEGKNVTSTSSMEIESSSSEANDYKYVEKFLEVLRNAKEDIKDTFKWKNQQ